MIIFFKWDSLDFRFHREKPRLFCYILRRQWGLAYTVTYKIVGSAPLPPRNVLQLYCLIKIVYFVCFAVLVESRSCILLKSIDIPTCIDHIYGSLLATGIFLMLVFKKMHSYWSDGKLYAAHNLTKDIEEEDFSNTTQEDRELITIINSRFHKIMELYSQFKEKYEDTFHTKIDSNYTSHENATVTTEKTEKGSFVLFGTYLISASAFHILVCLKNPEMYSSWIPYIDNARIQEKKSNYSSIFSINFANIPFIRENLQNKYVQGQWSVYDFRTEDDNILVYIEDISVPATPLAHCENNNRIHFDPFLICLTKIDEYHTQYSVITEISQRYTFIPSFLVNMIGSYILKKLFGFLEKKIEPIKELEFIAWDDDIQHSEWLRCKLAKD